MTVLCDRTLRHHIEIGVIHIAPRPSPDRIGPSSVDLTLGRRYFLPRAENAALPIDLGRDRHTLWRDLEAFRGPPLTAEGDEPITVLPGMFVHGETAEELAIPWNTQGRVDGRSLLGRFGLLVHITAQTMHPGWRGRLVLEFLNIGPSTLLLRPGMRICSVLYEMLDQTCAAPYRAPEAADAAP